MKLDAPKLHAVPQLPAAVYSAASASIAGSRHEHNPAYQQRLCLPQPLTPGTKVSSACREDNAANDGAASITGPAMAVEHLKPVLVTAYPAIDIVIGAEGRATSDDGRGEHVGDGCGEGVYAPGRQG